MRTHLRSILFISVVAAVAMLASGCCSYTQNRADDAKEIFDIGLTVTPQWTPEFGFYFDFFSVLPIGYAQLDNTLYGMATNGNSGKLDWNTEAWGLVLIGKDKVGSEFDAQDPYQARDDQRDLTERPSFDTGVVGLVTGDDPPPALPYTIQCDKIVHLGWVGVVLNCRLPELFDFILGWTTLDIMDDDDAVAAEE